MAPRNHPIPSQAQPTVNNHHHNNNTLISSGQNNVKPVEQTVHDEVSSEHMHDRLMFLLVNFIGMNVLVTVKNGAKYQGLLKTASTNGELGVVLKMARKVLTKAEEKTVQNRVIPTYIIMAKDLMEIHACEVDFSACEKLLSEREGSGAVFLTDTDISGRVEGRLEFREHSNNVSWDQFAVNEQLFGIKTDFNEEIYTTKLDRSRADFKERERQAIAIANEITRSSTTNVHMLEERGIMIEESQMDEEDKYGAVVRSRDPSKYMPPQLRKLQEQQLQQHTGPSPVAKKSEPSKEPAKEVISPGTETKPFRIPEPVAALLNSHTPRKTGIDAEGKPIEAQIVTTFRKFATNEKERLQQRKQAIARKEMDGKMAELLKWGQNFKLNSPLPQDLIPILTKDEVKRQQLAAKSSRKPEIKIEEDKSHKTNGDSTESKSANDKSSDKSISAADKAPLQFPPGRTTATTPTNSQFKLNAKASEWKPNPNAASFTPITPNTQDKRSPGSSPFFGNRQLKKNIATLRDGFTPFQKSKNVANPSSIPPTWPFGQRPFRHHFSVTNNYDEDMYSQAAVTQGFGFAAYPVTGPYRYPPNTQFVSVPPIPIQQGAPIPPYMQPGQFVPGMPFTTAPMPPTGAPPMYSAQLPSVMPQHFGSQGFPSPGRTPMVPATIHPQMYQPYQNPHAMAPMIRYPHDMVQHVSPNGVMIGQRPMMMEPHYLQPEAAPMEGMPVTEPTTINQ
ncbi:14193_t:CDS:10 [Funneliformis caledonium]|uniref:14193_t:CDS:1 n=1 Tax=Funneliformis caledonium TaxID=1117310 RepID=A0A9N9AGV9_9GLOM|nr:14193_t:CDS:10 [Funneliformis caledonium]